MKTILSLILLASALFGADAPKDPKDAEIAALKAQIAVLNATVREDAEKIAQRDRQNVRWGWILQAYEKGMDGTGVADAKKAKDAAIAKACADTGGKLDVPGVTCQK